MFAEAAVILDEIVAYKRELHARRQPLHEAQLYTAMALPPPRDFKAAIAGHGQLRVIAEFKRRSPSGGAIKPDADPKLVAGGYARAGAAAMSVLTDDRFFGAVDGDLPIARAESGLPVLRKDFLLDKRDVLESRLAGADAALLIVRLLDDERLRTLIEVARGIGLMALVEAHDDREIERALVAGADVIGVNHRDLDTLTIDLGLSARARKVAGSSVTLVAESGIQTPAHVAQMRAHGVDAILVGESLMRAADPGAALRALLAGA
jgi:indole-3-glycerol phosphate synthase